MTQDDLKPQTLESENAAAALLRLLREMVGTKGGDTPPAGSRSDEERDRYIEAALRQLGLLADEEPPVKANPKPRPRATRRRKKKTD
jgi:hypothetical protein